MADYSALKATIDASINTNGQQAITGAILNDVLNEMVDVLGEGYTFLGVATPTTSPTTPEGKAYYLAGAAGTYSNFGNIVVASDEVALLVWNGTAWSKVVSPAASKEEVRQLGQGFGLAISTSTTESVPYSIIAGKSYVIVSMSSPRFVDVTTRETSSGTRIDGPIRVLPNNLAILTATANANYIRFSDTFSGYIFLQTELYNLVGRETSELSTLITQVDEKVNGVQSSLTTQIAQKVGTKAGKNLFDKDSPFLRNNSCFDASGNVVSDAYTTYWLISNPIDVSAHQGEKIICNKSYNATTRYCCFEDVDGNKTAIKASIEAYTIPDDAVTAYILVYKDNGSVNLNEVQIEFGEASSEYEPYNPIGGYFTGEATEKNIFPPSPQSNMHESYATINTAYIYSIFDSWVTKFPQYITKTNLGRDASNTYDVNAYKIAFATNPIYKILFICNQHGGGANGDPIMGGYVATQFISDICGSGHRHNDRLMWIRNNVEIYIIPAANPWGIDNNRRVNYNGVNLNRNWPTSGWASADSGQGTDDYKGAAAGDQPELQHYLQYISDVQPDIIIDNHTLGGLEGVADANSGKMYIGFGKDVSDINDDYLSFISQLASIMAKEYGVTPTAYSVTGASPTCRNWCLENNFWGGLVEMQWRDPLDGELGFTPNIIEASYMLCLAIYQYYAISLP